MKKSSPGFGNDERNKQGMNMNSSRGHRKTKTENISPDQNRPITTELYETINHSVYYHQDGIIVTPSYISCFCAGGQAGKANEIEWAKLEINENFSGRWFN